MHMSGRRARKNIVASEAKEENYAAYTMENKLGKCIATAREIGDNAS